MLLDLRPRWDQSLSPPLSRGMVVTRYHGALFPLFVVNFLGQKIPVAHLENQ